MNTFAATGMLMRAHEGERIVVVARTEGLARDALDVVCQARGFDGASMTVRRAKGDAMVTSTSGGWVRFLSAQPGVLRGLSADAVYIEERTFDQVALGLIEDASRVADGCVVFP